MNIAAPNLINICIDNTDGMEKTGRMYCYYKEEPIPFRNSHELFRKMEILMNGLNYPQSSVELRTYSDRKQHKKDYEKRINTPDSNARQRILEQRGLLDTLVVYVQYRQSATWQGSVYHMADGSREDFHSELELLKIIDHAGENS